MDDETMSAAKNMAPASAGDPRTDSGTRVGAADADADRVRSGADEPGGAPLGLDEEEPTDDGMPIGEADRQADVERSS
jgi:hypothetical protein